MSSTPAANKILQPGPGFAFTFLLCVIPVAALVSGLPDAWWVAWRDLTMLVASRLGTLFGLAVTSQADILTVNGFAMRIIRQCIAVDYVVILALAMLLYARHSIPYRLLGLGFAVPAVLLGNACRLIVSGFIGTYSRSAFDFAHDYLWVIGFALFVFAIWSFWVNGRLRVPRAVARRVALIVAASAASYALLAAGKNAYGSLMALATSFMYLCLEGNPLVAISWNGSEVVCSYYGNAFYLKDLSEQVNIAVFIGLMVPLQKKGDGEMLGMTLFGVAAMLLTGALLTAFGCSQALAHGETGLASFVKIAGIIQLALPIAFYWILTSGTKREGAPVGAAGTAPLAVGPERVKKGGSGGAAR